MTEPDKAPLTVRSAGTDDVERIAEIQSAAMVETVLAIAGEQHRATVTQQLEPSLIASTWYQTLSSNPELDRGVLVAREGEEVTGFAAYIGTSEATVKELAEGSGGALPFEIPAGSAQILAMEVAPKHRRAGHGSRLLAAVADTARSHNTPGLLVWIVAEDPDRVRFFEKAGFAPVGLRRSLDTGAGIMTEHLWFAAL